MSISYNETPCLNSINHEKLLQKYIFPNHQGIHRSAAAAFIFELRTTATGTNIMTLMCHDTIPTQSKKVSRLFHCQRKLHRSALLIFSKEQL